MYSLGAELPSHVPATNFQVQLRVSHRDTRALYKTGIHIHVMAVQPQQTQRISSVDLSPVPLVLRGHCIGSLYSHYRRLGHDLPRPHKLESAVDTNLVD